MSEAPVDDKPPFAAVFYGLVHPQGGGWVFDEAVRAAFHEGRWTLTFHASRFQVVIHGSLPDDLDTFANGVRSIVQGCLDALGYCIGASLTAELTGAFIAPDRAVLIPVAWSDLLDTPPSSLRAEPEQLQPLVAATVAHPLLRLALSDLSLAIGRPDDTAFYCQRAIESVRHWLMEFDSVTRSREESWLHLRERLDVDEETLLRVRDASVARRHGELCPPTTTERRDLIQVARDVIRRAVDLLGRPLQLDRNVLQIAHGQDRHSGAPAAGE